MKLIVSLLAKELSARLSPARIDRAFSRLPAYSGISTPISLGKAGVCALQVEAKIYYSLADFVSDIDRYISMAVLSGAQLVCFPELFGLFTAFASPPVRWVFKLLTKKGGSGSEEASGFGSLDIASLYSPFEFLPERYMDIMGRFARRYGVWLSCGTILAYDNGKVYNRHYLLDDKGDIAGTSDKLHPVAAELALGIGRGGGLAVVETPLGRIALTVCMDATYFETFKIAKGLGADFAIVPIANAEPYNYHLALRGASSRVSETSLPAVKPALFSGKAFPIELTGRAGIYYPLGFGQKSREVDQGDTPAALTETPEITALREFIPEAFCLPNRQFNENLMSAYKQVHTL